MGRKPLHSKYTHFCKHCGTSFLAKVSDNEIYCGIPCKSRAIPVPNTRKVSECVICSKEFEHYGERIVCTRDCNVKYMSKMKLGKNNPAFVNSIKKECKNCNKRFKHRRRGLLKNPDPRFCSIICRQDFTKMESIVIPLKYVDPYPVELKEVKLHACSLCGQKNNLSNHHIDYDVDNNERENLITLCEACHKMTGSNKSFWEIAFASILSGSKIVKKGWGIEAHITNNSDYCLKYLIFFEGREFSFHSHQCKKELWHCLIGKFECVLDGPHGMEHSLFKRGDKIEIDRNIVHQLRAIKNSIIVEVSTQDFPEDSHRIIKGD